MASHKQLRMFSDVFFYIIISFIFFLPECICKSICVRPANPGSLFEVDSTGADIAKVLKHISTEVTSEFMIEILSAEAGHKTLLCNQKEWNKM